MRGPAPAFPFTGRHERTHLLDRLRDRMAEDANHYKKDGAVRCDGHVCQPGKHVRRSV